MNYLISAETRDELIDLLGELAASLGHLPGTIGGDAANILPHVKAAPSIDESHLLTFDNTHQRAERIAAGLCSTVVTLGEPSLDWCLTHNVKADMAHHFAENPDANTD